jgi:hypothetical protein
MLAGLRRVDTGCLCVMQMHLLRLLKDSHVAECNVILKSAVQVCGLTGLAWLGCTRCPGCVTMLWGCSSRYLTRPGGAGSTACCNSLAMGAPHGSGRVPWLANMHGCIR